MGSSFSDACAGSRSSLRLLMLVGPELSLHPHLLVSTLIPSVLSSSLMAQNTHLPMTPSLFSRPDLSPEVLRCLIDITTLTLVSPNLSS